MAKRGPALSTVCYLCGEMIAVRADVSRDHVPPLQLFPSSNVKEGRTQLRTVISHVACNNSFGPDEDYFRATVLPFSDGTPAATALLEDYRRTRAERPTVTQRWESRITTVTPNALTLPSGVFGMTVDDRRLNRVIWKIVRGLVYGDSSRLLPAEPPSSIKLLTRVQFDREHRAIYDRLPLETKVVMPGVFEYRHCSVTKNGITLSTFVLTLLDSVFAAVVFNDLA